MRTDDKKETVMINRQTAPATDTATAQTGAAPATDATTQTSAAPVATTPAAPQADPFADYMKESQRQYASTIADIRRRRQELEQRYQPNIERQKKIMKIMALGKLIGQLGQLAGGGAGTPVVDKDPYQINAWNELNRMRNEQRYYGQQLDAEERAAMNNMRTGLNRLALENAKQKAAMAQIQERARLTQETNAKRQAAQMEIERIRIQAREDLKKLGYDQAMKLMQQRFANSKALKELGYNNAEALAYLQADLRAGAETSSTTTYQRDSEGRTTSSTTTKRSSNSRAQQRSSGGGIGRMSGAAPVTI